jgi:hypothetical protein
MDLGAHSLFAGGREVGVGGGVAADLVAARAKVLQVVPGEKSHRWRVQVVSAEPRDLILLPFAHDRWANEKASSRTELLEDRSGAQGGLETIVEGERYEGLVDGPGREAGDGLAVRQERMAVEKRSEEVTEAVLLVREHGMEVENLDARSREVAARAARERIGEIQGPQGCVPRSQT